LPQAANAQSLKPEAEEPLPTEDIAASVEAINALKQDKTKVKVYCGVVDMLDDAEGDHDATGTAAAKSLSIPRPTNHGTQKLKRLSPHLAKISATPITRWQTCLKIPQLANRWWRLLKNWKNLAIARVSEPNLQLPAFNPSIRCGCRASHRR
jgi:hypothetical protein